MTKILDALLYFLQSGAEEENEKAFLILNEMILTLKDVSMLFSSLLFQFVGA